MAGTETRKVKKTRTALPIAASGVLVGAKGKGVLWKRGGNDDGPCCERTSEWVLIVVLVLETGDGSCGCGSSTHLSTDTSPTVSPSPHCRRSASGSASIPIPARRQSRALPSPRIVDPPRRT